MVVLFIYLALLTGIGIYDYFRIRNFDDYVVAGRKQKTAAVTLSILATVMGASATMGISSLAANYGFYAFLWLGSGGIALMLQSFFLSEKIRNLEVYTLPGLAEVVAGKWGRIISASVILISWTGIIAAQFIALSSIVALLAGREPGFLLIVACSSVIIFYTAFGGQFSIIKTDSLQFLILAAGIVTALAVVFIQPLSEASLLSAFMYKGNSSQSMTAVKIFHLLFIVGGAYFVGPDIFSRNFTSDTAKTAKKATLWAAMILLAASLVITLTGIGAAMQGLPEGVNPYVFIIKNLAGKPATLVILLGLISAIISSTDTCIITTAAIFENDILGKKDVKITRIIVLATGYASLLLALFKKDILALLTGTYSVFSPGIVLPVFIAVTAFGKRKISKKIWVSAVAAGGLAGIASNLTGLEYLSLAGMAVSAAIALVSVRNKKDQKPRKQESLR